jgi:purine-nucleoside phosphorylase
VLVVLGTGLGPVAGMLGADSPPLDLTTLPWFPRFGGLGHRSDAWSVEVGDARLLITAGRSHLYEERTPAEVAHTVRTAVAAGCRTVILTCAAGGIRPDLVPGQVVAVADHLNLTGTSPLIGVPVDHHVASPFVDLTDAWDPGLRAAARAADPGLAEGVYAQLPGPHLETPAEIRMLATLGADLVGMSMALECIAARHLGARVAGLAVVTNPAAGTAVHTLSDAAMHEVAEGAAGEVTRLVGALIAASALAAPPGDGGPSEAPS